MDTRYFSNLIPELATRSARATISMLGFSNKALRAHLREAFASAYGEQGSFLGDPVFEATFGWAPADKSLGELSGSLLCPSLVAALNEPPGGKDSEYRFAVGTHPYRHQLEAWQILAQDPPQSIVVTSGTGSGKTECFMIPILDRLAREHAEKKSQLVGVRALFLYPLNALINSQRDRLRAWTHHFGANVRFCLYNGMTPNMLPAHQHRESHNEAIDRKALRESPPPILVTNATMLEYMLVRAQDAPILQKSQGTLQWIVLDEAHSYIGSQAAELALLLRRVLHGFGVSADQVRFVATSATIGDTRGDAAKRLAEFLSSLAGIPVERVHVVSGQREIPALLATEPAPQDNAREALEQIDHRAEFAPNRFDALSANRIALRFRNAFAAEGGKKPAWQLKELTRQVFGETAASDQNGLVETLRWLDLLTSTRRKTKNGVEPFLPLRTHIFHQTLHGLWACADSACGSKTGTSLDSPEWPYGQVYFDDRKHCSCGAPVYEIRSCNDCNTSFLWGRLVSQSGKQFIRHARDDNPDEFSLEVEESEGDGEVEMDAEVLEAEGNSILIANGCSSAVEQVRLDKVTLELDVEAGGDSISIKVRQAMPTDDAGSVLSCPACQGHNDRSDGFMFRRAILGAPFLLGQVIPTLLEFCPDGPIPLDRPYRGRRMISFTDSRQGTARIAAKIQQDSERNRVRGLVFHRVTSTIPNGNTEQTQALRDQIASLQAVAHAPGIAQVIATLRSQIDDKEAPTVFPFDDTASWLGTNEADICKWMFGYYHRADPDSFRDGTGQLELARMALAREFARRPKRLNSLETMGLVAIQYPRLEAVTQPPPVPLQTPLSLDDWKNFLKICLDFHVRENTFVNLPESWKKWGGNRIFRKWLLPPTSQERPTSAIRKWPQSRSGGRQNRLVRLLAYSLKLDPTSPQGRDTIDALLRAAWDALCACGLLEASASGRFLSFTNMAFIRPAKAWLCPVTRRVLDVTFKGVTPYLPEEPTRETAECQEIALPQFDLSGMNFDSDSDRIEATRQWLSDSDDITKLRDEGIWSDLSDRIVEGAAYFRAAEHSAQQPSDRLQLYEREFKDGRLNLLSCSTTMEMGVDIGGISVVAMNNVPPHPANYLQRAGRAGRRAETRSVALTVCKNNPHDQHVFLNTRWPFDTQLPMPGISLSSSVIVQRHVNSMLLAHFLRYTLDAQSIDLNKLDCEWFFLSEETCRSDQFIAWCENFSETTGGNLTIGLRNLIRSTCFEGVATLSSLTLKAAAEMVRVQAAWMAEYLAASAQLSMFSGAALQAEPAAKALEIQMKRLTREYLLTELATEGFLPGYGFPTDLASFDNLNIDQLKAQAARQGHREDNLMRRRDLATRDRVTALREYAPGADVVMDGMVYRSAGITLNWHAPADNLDISEIQNIRRAWRCTSCGATGTAPNHVSGLHCSDCGASIIGEQIKTFLEPSGFAVDLYEAAHNDISTQQYVPVEAPWIQAEGDWIPLPNAALGRFRSSPGGHVFYHSAGTSGAGYAICLHCGRAEPMPTHHDDADTTADGSEASLPKVFQKPHRKLRGKQGGEFSECPGSHNPWAIKRNIFLGHSVRTDVLELQLKDRNGLYLYDPGIAFTFSVAIRNAIADLLGIEADELGCDTKPVRTEGANYCTAVVIYDRNAGGYCTTILSLMPEVFRRARNQLECPKACDSACQHCLLSFDVRFRFDDLNRLPALEFLTEDWLNHLRLPEKNSHFGPGTSFAEYQPLAESIWRELGKSDSMKLRLYFSGEPANWDVATSPVRQLIYRWMAKEKPITLVLPRNSLPQLSEENRFILAALASPNLVSVIESEHIPGVANGTVLAEIRKPNGYVYWAAHDVATGDFGPLWGDLGPGDVLVRGHSATRLGRQGNEPVLTPQVIRPAAATDLSNVEIAIQGELDGPLQGFGRRFWEHLCKSAPELGQRLMDPADELVQVIYRDRYINSPIALATLVEVISRLKESGSASEHLAQLKVVTVWFTAGERMKPPLNLWSDWVSSDQRDAVLVRAFDWCGINCKLDVADKSKTHHARSLELDFASGARFRIRLDQGVSYWQVARDLSKARGWNAAHFDFSEELATQAQRIAELSVKLAGQAFPTYIWVRKEPDGKTGP